MEALRAEHNVDCSTATLSTVLFTESVVAVVVSCVNAAEGNVGRITLIGFLVKDHQSDRHSSF